MEENVWAPLPGSMRIAYYYIICGKEREGGKLFATVTDNNQLAYKIKLQYFNWILQKWHKLFRQTTVLKIN